MGSRKSSPAGSRKKKPKDPTAEEIRVGMGMRVRELKLREALLRWANLPLERRQNVVSYWMDEIREQLEYARSMGDSNEAASARLWAEENLVVIDLLNAIVPTPLPRRPRKRTAR